MARDVYQKVRREFHQEVERTGRPLPCSWRSVEVEFEETGRPLRPLRWGRRRRPRPRAGRARRRVLRRRRGAAGGPPPRALYAPPRWGQETVRRAREALASREERPSRRESLGAAQTRRSARRERVRSASQEWGEGPGPTSLGRASAAPVNLRGDESPPAGGARPTGCMPAEGCSAGQSRARECQQTFGSKCGLPPAAQWRGGSGAPPRSGGAAATGWGTQKTVGGLPKRGRRGQAARARRTGKYRARRSAA